MLVAITRGVSPRIGACEMTHLPRTSIDTDLARAQHRRYEAALTKLGCEVVTLAPLPDLPDSVFVEDVAVVLDEIAILTRPGAESRRPEVEHIREALMMFRPVEAIRAPGTLEGGDVLRVGNLVYVGRSGRSNEAGIDQLRAWLTPFGYRVISAPVRECLHLKSGVSEVAPGVLLFNPAWVHPAVIGGEEMIEVDPAEPYAANGLRVGSHLVYPASFPRTRAILESRGIAIEIVDVSELQKAEGAVTCCSLILNT
jgi:dimethylargininase